MNCKIRAWITGAGLATWIMVLHVKEHKDRELVSKRRSEGEAEVVSEEGVEAENSSIADKPEKAMTPETRNKPSPDLVPYLAPLYAAAAMLIFAHCFMKVDFWAEIDSAWRFLEKPTDVSLPRFAAALALIGAWIIAALKIQAEIGLPKAVWWNLGGKSSPSWEDVRAMTLNCPANDPVICKPSRNRLMRIGTGAVGHFILVALLIEGLIFLADGPVLPKLLTEITTTPPQLADPRYPIHHIDLQLNANLTALLALIAAAISIYFTHRQLQAKVKADSRQAWLDKLRGEIARFIALADTIHDDPDAENVATLRKKMAASRLEMELMLNPSEKDHRLLMFLSIKLAFHLWDDELFRKVHDVQNLVHAIETDPAGYVESDWKELLGPIPDKSVDSTERSQAFSNLVGYVMRLSHVVLKREWERVKHTR